MEKFLWLVRSRVQVQVVSGVDAEAQRKQTSGLWDGHYGARFGGRRAS